MRARMFDRRGQGYEAVGYTIQAPGSAAAGWPAEVPRPVDPEWKRDYAAKGAGRIEHRKTTRLLAAWHEQVHGGELFPGESFNLDFHSVPYYGEHPLIQRHDGSMRSRRQPSVLAKGLRSTL